MVLAPLKVHARCVADDDTIRKHVEYCMTLGLKVFMQSPGPHDLEAVLVGSGPSVKSQVNKLKSMSKNPKYKFFGIKGGHDFLLKHKIEPDFALCVDPLEINYELNFLREAKHCTYLIASQCHPKLFDHLLERGKNVVIWHLITDPMIRWSREEGSPIYHHCMVHGGSTSGLRTVVLAYLAGFRKMHLFGFDSCLSGTLRKVDGEIYDEKKADGSSKAMVVVMNDKKFMCDPAFASQANEFQDLMNSLWNPADPFKIRGYGQGLIQEIIKQRYRDGHPEALI